MSDRSAEIANAILTDPTLSALFGAGIDAEIRRRWPGVTDGEIMHAGILAAAEIGERQRRATGGGAAP